jgi:SAM-dependent methyltransferase
MVESIGNFDSHASNYEQALSDSLGIFGETSSYFAQYKLNILIECIDQHEIKSVLDYGSGVGSSIPCIREKFPDSEVWATDLSIKSLEILKSRYPLTQISETSALPKRYFDLIFVSCVIHHIPVSDRLEIMHQLFNYLSPNGRLCIFEHNPYSPITRRIVSNCEFDDGVVLINNSSLKKIILKVSPKSTIKSGYCLFFPSFLSKLFYFEKFLRWLPFGGQYFVIAQDQNNK